MSERQLQVSVITPEGAAFEGTASAVVVPAYDGEIAFLPLHAPFVGALGAGELRIEAEDGESTYLFLQGGVVRVADDQVAILAESVVPIDALDVEEERRRLDEALGVKAVDSLESLDSRQLAADAARARIRAAEKVQGQ